MNENKRQFCRKGIHTCVPAVTLTFDNGTGALHWCSEHAEDAERYRDQSDQREQRDHTPPSSEDIAFIKDIAVRFASIEGTGIGHPGVAARGAVLREWFAWIDSPERGYSEDVLEAAHWLFSWVASLPWEREEVAS